MNVVVLKEVMPLEAFRKFCQLCSFLFGFLFLLLCFFSEPNNIMPPCSSQLLSPNTSFSKFYKPLGINSLIQEVNILECSRNCIWSSHHATPPLILCHSGISPWKYSRFCKLQMFWVHLGMVSQICRFCTSPKISTGSTPFF